MIKFSLSSESNCRIGSVLTSSPSASDLTSLSIKVNLLPLSGKLLLGDTLNFHIHSAWSSCVIAKIEVKDRRQKDAYLDSESVNAEETALLQVELSDPVFIESDSENWKILKVYLSDS